MMKLPKFSHDKISMMHDCKYSKTQFNGLLAEFKITDRHWPIFNHNYSLVNIFGPFSDYLIGHPLTLQVATTVV